MPMDNLRDRIRSRKNQTQDLPHSMEKVSRSFAAEDESSKTGTHDLLKQLASGQPTAELNLKPVGKQSLAHSMLDKLKPLEVNKKMLGVSVVVAAVASLLAMNYLNSIANPLKEQSKPIQVLMLTQDVPARTVLKQEMLSVKEIPAGFLPKGVLEYQPNIKILGKVALTDLYQGEVLHQSRVAMPNQNTGVSMIIPAGHRAITIRTGNAHLMKPSDHVDVIASIPDLNPSRRGKTITYPILQDAAILAVGNQLSAEAADNGRYGAQNITVAVPEDRVSLMSLLEEKGKFNVVLRAPGDKTKMPEAYTVEEITDALTGKFEPAKTVPAALSGAEKELQKIKDLAAKEVKNEPAKEEKLVDLSVPAAPVYHAPAPAYRAPVYRAPAPVYRPPAAPVYRAPAPAAPVYRAPAPAAPKTVTVINGGTMTQVNGGN